MNNKRKIVIFDFCETLVDFQTADAFVDYVRIKTNDATLLNKEHIYQNAIQNYLFRLICTVFKHLSLSKRLKLYQLKGVEKRTIDTLAYNYYIEQIKPHIINKTLEILEDYQNRGFDIWIVSGGYDVYLKYFMDDYNINQLLCSRIKMKGPFCTGTIYGKDCMFTNKVSLFKQRISKITKDYEVVASFSDSKTDLPILRIAKEGYVVCHKENYWANKYKFKTVIW